MKRESLTEAHERTGLSRKVLRQAALRGKIPFLRNGEGPTATILMWPADVDAYVKTLSNTRALSPREYAECARMAKGEA